MKIRYWRDVSLTDSSIMIVLGVDYLLFEPVHVEVVRSCTSNREYRD